MPISRRLPIIGRSIIAQGTAEVLFGLKDTPFDFLAGQYVKVTIPNPTHTDGKNNSREFSIASSPYEKKLRIAFRISESGFKKNLLEAPIGTEIVVEGPFGVFTLPSGFRNTVVCIAGGIGITPFLSMATFAAEEKSHYKIILLYANNSPESTAYRDMLHNLEKTNHNLAVKEKIGFIDDAFVLESVRECFADASCLWYIAGPPGMVYRTRQILLQNGAEEKKIYTEEFSDYKD